MPTIAQAVATNEQRIAAQGTSPVTPSAALTQPSPPPLADGPTDRPRRGSFPRSLIASDTYEKVQGQFYGRMRARTLTNPGGSDLPSVASAIGTSKTTVVTFVPTPDSDPFLHFRGTWNSAATYLVNDVVIDNLSAYVAIAGSTGVEPDQGNTSNWALLSENLVFNPTINTTAGHALGLFDSQVTTTGSSATLSGGPIAPAAANELAIWFGDFSNGGSPATATAINSITPAGWTQFSFPTGGFSAFSAAIFKFLSSSSSISPTANIGSSQPWCSILTTWSFTGSLTATITSVQVDGGNVCTVTCANTFLAGEFVALSGLTNATFLNGQNVQITSATPTQIVFSFTHAAYGPTSDTGTASLFLALQSNGSSGAVTSPSTLVLPNPVVGGNTIVVTLMSGNGVVINSVTDNQGNSYRLFTAPNTIGLSVAFAQNVKAGSTTVTVNSSGTATGANILAVEMVSGLSFANYLPYDVVEFRGSLFVCLQATSNDPFTQPAAWGLVGPGTGFTQLKTANYTAVQSDEGNLLSFNSSSNLTLTLPFPLPTVQGKIDSGFWIAVQNLGTGTLTISSNSRTIDGASSLVLLQNQGCLVFTDGLNFYTVRAAASGSGFAGGVNSQTTNYTAVFGDGGKLISMNGSNLTLTLPNPPPNSIWMVHVENLNSTNLTISPNSLNIDGSGSSLTLGQNQGITIFTDGTNYFTLHGVNRLTVPSFLTVAAPDGSGNVAISSATVSPSQAVIGPTQCSASGPLTARQIQGNDLANLNITDVFVVNSISNQNGNLRLCGSVLPAGLYRVSVYVVITNTGSGNLSATITWNDGTASQTFSPSNISTTVTGAIMQFDIVVLSDGVHDITYNFQLI
jgi:hypothetical protein